ncbi:hypothetical protein F5887DRAFT_1217083 [Amanita rubescens]|nr:hypothetical protein F5887DRAFT_1217083 [Amanita rubescens]
MCGRSENRSKRRRRSRSRTWRLSWWCLIISWKNLEERKISWRTGTIPDLEMQLRQVVEEIDKMEAEERDLELAYATFSHNQAAADEMGMLRHPNRTASECAAQQPQQHRGRHHSFHSTPSTVRQSIPSTQRSNTLQAPSTSATHPNLQHIWNTTPTRQAQVQRQQHTSRFTYPQSTSLSHIRSQPPIILTNPNRKKSGSTSSLHQTHGSANGSFSSSTSFGTSLVSSPSSNSSSTVSSPNPGGTLTSVPEQVSVSSTASTSTLSSRAPVFEPGVGIGLLSKLQRQGYASTGIGEPETTSKVIWCDQSWFTDRTSRILLHLLYSGETTTKTSFNDCILFICIFIRHGFSVLHVLCILSPTVYHTGVFACSVLDLCFFFMRCSICMSRLRVHVNY